MQPSDGPVLVDGVPRRIDPERRRQAWRRIVLRQLTRLCARAEGSDLAARDAAARAARLAALLGLDEPGVPPVPVR